MAVITISAYNVPLVQSGDSSLLLRLCCNQNYTTYEGVDVIAGTGETGSWYKEYSCPVTTNVAAVPQVTIYATEDRTTGQDPKWTGIFYDPTGTQIRGYLFPYALRITATPLTTTWDKIAVFNCLPPQIYIYGYLNSNQSDARYPQLDGLTAGTLPKVSTVSPPVLADSLFSDNSTDADIELGSSNALRFGGTTSLDPMWKRSGSTLEFRTADNSAILSPVLGGVTANFGQVGTITANCASTGTQTIFTAPSANIVVPVFGILRTPSQNLALWTSTIKFGVTGGSEWWDGNASDLALTSLSTLNYITPDVGAVTVPVSTAFTVKFGTAFGSPATIIIDIFGYKIL